MAWTASAASATSGATMTVGIFTSEPQATASTSVATAWQEYMNVAANAAAAAANASMNAWALYANATAGAAKIAADAEADASEAFTLSAIDHFLTAIEDQAAAVKDATKDIAADQADAAHDAISAGETRATTETNLAKADADAKIDAAQEASNGVVDLIYVYNVASIGVGLLATTAATGFALLRENGGITAVSAAQRDAINASYTQTISILADDLIGRNANEALDDPIAIAAANQSATAAVRDAWQNISNLQARAAETFAGTGPGGYGMMVAGMFSGLEEIGEIGWAGFVGAGQGLAAWADGFIPFFEPFDFLYDPTDSTLQWSRFFGGVSRESLLLALSIMPWSAAPAGAGQVVTHWGPRGMTALRSGDWVMTGVPNAVRYVLSGVIQPGRHFQWPWNFIVRPVAQNTLRSPGGWEAIKWYLGQRIYLP